MSTPNMVPKTSIATYSSVFQSLPGFQPNFGLEKKIPELVGRSPKFEATAENLQHPMHLFAPYSFLSPPFFSSFSPFPTLSSTFHNNSVLTIQQLLGKSELRQEQPNFIHGVVTETNPNTVEDTFNRLLLRKQALDRSFQTSSFDQNVNSLDLNTLYAYQYLQNMQQLQTFYNLQTVQQNNTVLTPDNNSTSNCSTNKETSQTKSLFSAEPSQKRKASSDFSFDKLLEPESKSKQARLERRKEKKSSRERQRRIAIATLFSQLNSLISQKLSNSASLNNNSISDVAKVSIRAKPSASFASFASSAEEETETRNRGSILNDLLSYFSSKLNKSVPALPKSLCASNDFSLLENTEEDTNKEGILKSETSQVLLSDKAKRVKKSQREKQRRTEVNILAMKLGLLLEVKEFKDKLIVLQTAKMAF